MNTKETERLINWGELPSPTGSPKEALEGAYKPLEEGGSTDGSCCGLEPPNGLLEDLGFDDSCKDCK